MWPAFDVWGSKTWVIARYRESSRHKWKWLDPTFHPKDLRSAPKDPTTVVFPEAVDPHSKKGKELLFKDEAEDLYHIPQFGSAIWTTPDKEKLIAAWLPPEKRQDLKKYLMESGATAILLPPPARFNDQPTTFIVRAGHDSVEFPKEIAWIQEEKSRPRGDAASVVKVDFPDTFKADYLKDLKIFSGETPIKDPETGKRIDFGKLGSAQKDNQILNLISFLKADYKRLGFGVRPGFEMVEQPFKWRGIPQANLVLKIKGRLPPKENRPIVVTDHIDKAIAEDIYETTGERITNPGANDNGTATATLRRAAEILADRYTDIQPEHDIWLVHFTGEEFPASSLGARHFVSELLKNGQDIKVNINLDMLGHRTPGDRVFQVSPGELPASTKAALDVLEVAKTLSGKKWKPTFRFPWGRQSYIQQTDATVFDHAGYPTVFINEHINLSRRVNPYYHQSEDLPRHVDLDYATIQAQTAIESAVRFAETR